jgi:hypothetical protein
MDYSLKLSVANSGEMAAKVLLFSASATAQLNLDTSFASQLDQSTAVLKSMSVEGYVGLDLSSECLASSNFSARARAALLALPVSEHLSGAEWAAYYEFFGMQKAASGGKWTFLPALTLKGFGSHMLTSVEVGANYLRTARAQTQSSETKFALAQNACVNVYVKVYDEFSASTMDQKNSYKNNVNTDLVGGQASTRSCTSGDDACVQRFLTSSSEPAGQSTPITFNLTPLWDLLPLMFVREAPEVRARILLVADRMRQSYISMSTYFWRCGPGMCDVGTCVQMGSEFRCEGSAGCGANTMSSPRGACVPKIPCSADVDCVANVRQQRVVARAGGGVGGVYEGLRCMQDVIVAPGVGRCLSESDGALFRSVGWKNI